MQRWIPYLQYYPYVLAGLLIFGLVLLFIALYNIYLHKRGDKLWRVRHDAGKRGSRLLLVSIVLLLSTLVVSFFSAVVIVSLGYEMTFFPPDNPYDVSGVAMSSLTTPTVSDTTLTVIAADTTISDSQTANNPRNTFDEGISRLYFFIAYQNIPVGSTWSRTLTHDDRLIQSSEHPWVLEPSGTGFFFFDNPAGYPTGAYQVTLYVDGVQQDTFDFSIR